MAYPSLIEPAAAAPTAGEAPWKAPPRREAEGPLPPPVLLDWLAERGPELLRRRPDASRLEAQLADLHAVSARRVLVTAGADDALERICRLGLSRGNRVTTTDPAPEGVVRAVGAAGAERAAAPWLAGPFPRRALVERIDGQSGAVVVATPNDPTGRVAPLADLLALRAASARPILAVDLRFAEYAREDPTTALLELPDTVVVRSLGHAWGLGGLGVGYLIGPAGVVERLRELGPAAPVAGPSLTVAEDWLSAGAHRVRQGVRRVRQERAALVDLLEALGARPLHSEANFVLAWFADAPGVAAGLEARGVAVRGFAPGSVLGEFLRISCPGESEGFARLSEALREVVGERSGV